MPRKSERQASIELDSMYNDEFEGFMVCWDSNSDCLLIDYESSEILIQALSQSDHEQSKDIIEKLKSYRTRFLDMKYGRPKDCPYNDPTYGDNEEDLPIKEDY